MGVVQGMETVLAGRVFLPIPVPNTQSQYLLKHGWFSLCTGTL